MTRPASQDGGGGGAPEAAAASRLLRRVPRGWQRTGRAEGRQTGGCCLCAPRGRGWAVRRRRREMLVLGLASPSST